MDKREMKKYIVISNFRLKQPNRGNAALCYGSFSFLLEKGLLHKGQSLAIFHVFKKFWKLRNLRTHTETVELEGSKWEYKEFPVFFLEAWLIKKLGIILPFTPFGKHVKEVALEAADYGGDGFADIYGTPLFFNRMNQTELLRKADVPLVMLPQTIGPFKDKQNERVALDVMRYASEVYVRDRAYVKELDKAGIKYTVSKDISAFMKPQPWDIDIKDNAVGLNVSGLAYHNNFKDLAGQFDAYPELIDRIISHFQQKGCNVYLIPHSYDYQLPDDNDDMTACREAYDRHADKTGLYVVDKDMLAPEVKYVISRMTFFMGARMHANFAAIYTGVPVFGMAYSYKFAGAFAANGLDAEKQTAVINNLSTQDINSYIAKIDSYYNESVNQKQGK